MDQYKAKDLSAVTRAIALVKTKAIGVNNSYKLAKLNKEIVDAMNPIIEVINELRDSYQVKLAEETEDDKKKEIVEEANKKIEEADNQLIEMNINLTLDAHEDFTPEFLGTLMTILGAKFVLNGLPE